MGLGMNDKFYRVEDVKAEILQRLEEKRDRVGMRIGRLWCQHCKALQKANGTNVECLYYPLDEVPGFCAACEDAKAEILGAMEEKDE